MLRFAGVKAPRPSTAWAGAAFAFALLAPAAFSAAQAQEVDIGGCVGGWHAFNCVTVWAPAGDPFVRHVPQPKTPAEVDRAKELDRRWVAYCRPVIFYDRYGVARYRYAEPGCEFGAGEY